MFETFSIIFSNICFLNCKLWFSNCKLVTNVFMPGSDRSVGPVNPGSDHYSDSGLVLKSDKIKTEKLGKIVINPEPGEPVKPAGSRFKKILQNLNVNQCFLIQNIVIKPKMLI